MNCKKCHEKLSKMEVQEIHEAQDNGEHTEYICNDCAELMNEPLQCDDYSDADSGL